MKCTQILIRQPLGDTSLWNTSLWLEDTPVRLSPGRKFLKTIKTEDSKLNNLGPDHDIVSIPAVMLAGVSKQGVLGRGVGHSCAEAGMGILPRGHGQEGHALPQLSPVLSLHASSCRHLSSFSPPPPPPLSSHAPTLPLYTPCLHVVSLHLVTSMTPTAKSYQQFRDTIHDTVPQWLKAAPAVSKQGGGRAGSLHHRIWYRSVNQQ